MKVCEGEGWVGLRGVRDVLEGKVLIAVCIVGVFGVSYSNHLRVVRAASCQPVCPVTA